MADILISDVPDEVLFAIDAKASGVGLSRDAYLRRVLDRQREKRAGPVTIEHLQRVACLARDLQDPDVMAGAWS